jgi:molecular chaperone GrpE
MIGSPKAPPVVADSAANPALLHAALAAQKDAYVRLAADFDNFRKRTRRDSEQQSLAEKESFILDLLPVLDDLERALSREQPGSFEQMYEGVAMTLHRLAQLIHRHGIEAVEDLGRPFDPHRHEAVSLAHDPRQPDDVILKVIQRGYCRGDKMFRPAKVIVNSLDGAIDDGRRR